ncbi:hypothetical protein MCHI_000892 [Candidatus Magnetoovum chiemensis]|nr:hypothetical protein MCHI_000892 [Candidatus Magnetoovum chiemensis]
MSIINRFTITALFTIGFETAQAISRRPGIRASLDSLIMKAFNGAAENDSSAEEINLYAQEIVRLFHVKHLHPKRIAIDGVPGSGKSTLARLLADKLDFQWRCLDHEDMDIPIDFSSGHTIYEHHRLLRTQNIDRFDVIIYIDEPVEISKAKVLSRKRGGYLIDIMNYDMLKQIGQKAFNIADGEEFNIEDSYIKIKFKPHGGYRADDNIAEELRQKGIDAPNLTKEELLFLSIYNEPKKGFSAYINSNAYTKELLTGIKNGIARTISLKPRYK